MAASVAIQFVGGLVFGSFLSVVAHRVPRGESFVSGRSRCPSCGAQMRALDNVPVLSWLLLRGRCRSCDERIGARYPLTELGLGALWVATYLILGDDDVTAPRARPRALRGARHRHAHRSRAAPDPQRRASARAPSPRSRSSRSATRGRSPLTRSRPSPPVAGSSSSPSPIPAEWGWATSSWSR